MDNFDGGANGPGVPHCLCVHKEFTWRTLLFRIANGRVSSDICSDVAYAHTRLYSFVIGQ